MRRRKQARAGNAPTPPAPSVEELLNIRLLRWQAYADGHLGALCDELKDIYQAAEEHAPDGKLLPHDPITLPFWAFVAVVWLADEDAVTNSRKRGRHAMWWRRYREDLIHWHRLRARAATAGRQMAGWPDNAAGLPNVFEVISRELDGTGFAGRPGTIKTSYETVAAALKAGQHARFYGSTTAFSYYNLLGNQPSS